MESIIILAARNQISLNNYNSQLAPIHGKPALFWILDLYYKEKNVIVVINERNKILKNYMQMSYSDITCISIQQDEMYKKHGQNSILTSFYEGVKKLHHETDSITIVLGDSYCKMKKYPFSDYILTYSDTKNEPSDKWCFVEKTSDGFVSEFYDKQTNIDTKGKDIVTGIYHFSNMQVLRECLVKEIKAKHNSLASLVAAYNTKIPVRCINNETWLDFGHRSGILKAQKLFYNSRNFNAISVDDITNTLTKRSAKKKKLIDEYFWYKNMPNELQSFVPRVFNTNENNEIFEINMENYGYPPLSELWLYGDYDYDLWKLIIKRLVDIRIYMNKFTGNLDKKNYEQLYVTKFFNRLDELKTLAPYWEKLLAQKTIIVNGDTLNNLPKYFEQLRNVFERIANSAKTSVMHGDYCFSNILFDTQNFVCKLIDPRGRLLDQTIYGDSRYDFAKLRHSLAGNYDYIVHGAYFFSEEDGKFNYKDGCIEDRTPLVKHFDNLLEQYGYDIKEIKLIEASLFLSMIPLHTDSFEQQKIFYIKGIQKLNECFGDK